MALLNWVFLKKFLFSGVVIGLASTPLILIKKHGILSNAGYISEYKRNLSSLGNKYADSADSFGLKEFSQEVFKSREMKGVIEEVFVKDFAFNFLSSQKSKLHSSKFRSFSSEEQKNHDESLETIRKTSSVFVPQKLYDDHGGTRKDMRRRFISDKAFAFLKEEILKFGKENFTLNKYSNNDYQPIKKTFYLSKSELSQNWDKIGFYPIVDEEYVKHHDLRSFHSEKFKFINWAYKKWFQEVKPFYIWMSLWKYKENATTQELESQWDRSVLKDQFPSKASYEFPYFETDDSQKISTTTKFKYFFKNIVNQNEENIFVPRGYTDDNSTSIYAEADNMYSKLYVKFAAAANYKYQQVLKQAQQAGSTINSRENAKVEVEKYKQPYELFLFDSNTANTQGDKRYPIVKINKEIKKEEKAKELVADAVEIKDTPWIFIRNSAGIHAVGIDSYSKNAQDSLGKIFHKFNYRTLQILLKKKLNLEKTLDIAEDSAITSFKTFIENQFSRLLLKYIYENASSNKVFNTKIGNSITDFKDAYDLLDKLECIRQKYQKSLHLRESIINEYAFKEWETENRKFKHAAHKYGLAGALPYDISGEDKVFKDLEELYEIDFFAALQNRSRRQAGEAGEAGGKLLDDFKKQRQEFEKKLTEYLSKLNLRLSSSATTAESDRIFSNSYLINTLIDKFLDKESAFNQLLFKFQLATTYIGKSVLGNKGFVKAQKAQKAQEQQVSEQDLEIRVPDDKKDKSNESTSWFDFLEQKQQQDEKIKKIYGDLESALNRFYYSRYFLSRVGNNPWDILKYSGKLFKEEKEELKQELLKVAKESFDERFYLDIDGTKEQHYKFLSTLVYLTKDDFSGFRHIVSSKISPTDDAWLILEQPESTGEVKKWVSPYLSSTLSTQDESKDELPTDASSFLNRKFFDDFKGLYVSGSERSWARIPDEYKQDLVSKRLYKFGKDVDAMKKYVEGISLDSEFRKVAAAIKKVANEVKNEDKDWASWLELDHIYIKESQESTYRSLTLQEKKNLLLAFLNKVNVSISNGSEINKNEYKSVFLADPDNGFAFTGSHTSATSAKITEAFFRQSLILLKDSSGKVKYAAFQINASSFSDKENFKAFANTLDRNLFWRWVIDMALRPEIQSSAIKDLESNSDKIKVYDSRWKKLANAHFVS